MNLRRAGLDDRAGIEAVVHAAYSPYVARIGREPGPMGDDYATLIAKGRVHVAGVVQGVLVLLPETDTMLLDNLAVAPAAQGQGIGRQMMAFAEQVARDADYRSIRLYTHALMTENVVLYARNGYVETHRAEEKAFKRVYMTKSLEPHDA